MYEILLPKGVGYKLDFVPTFQELQNLVVLINYSNTQTVLNKVLKYDTVYWDNSEVLKVDHCKTKVKTVWKGKHCKPFYQTSRW